MQFINLLLITAGCIIANPIDKEFDVPVSSNLMMVQPAEPLPFRYILVEPSTDITRFQLEPIYEGQLLASSPDTKLQRRSDEIPNAEAKPEEKDNEAPLALDTRPNDASLNDPSELNINEPSTPAASGEDSGSAVAGTNPAEPWGWGGRGWGWGGRWGWGGNCGGFLGGSCGVPCGGFYGGNCGGPCGGHFYC